MNAKTPKIKSKHKRKGRENQKFTIVYVYAKKRKEAESKKKDIPQKKNAESSTMHQFEEESQRKIGEENTQSNDWEFGKGKVRRGEV